MFFSRSAREGKVWCNSKVQVSSFYVELFRGWLLLLFGVCNDSCLYKAKQTLRLVQNNLGPNFLRKWGGPL